MQEQNVQNFNNFQYSFFLVGFYQERFGDFQSIDLEISATLQRTGDLFLFYQNDSMNL